MIIARLVAPFFLALYAFFVFLAPAMALDPAEHTTVGQTVHVTLTSADTKDYTISLTPGYYVILLDSERSDGSSGNIQANVRLLKNNGVVVDSDLLDCNEIAVETRVGKQFYVPKALPARLRVTSQQDIPTDYWLTVMTAKAAHFVPFGFGKSVSPAVVGSDQGAGGTLDKSDSAYYTATLKPGKWSISLGLSTTDGSSTNLQGQVDLLNTLGEPTKEQFVVMNAIDKESRQEGILTVVNPTTYMFHVINTNASTPYNYDLTIEPATD